MNIAKLEHKIAARGSSTTDERCDELVLASEKGRSRQEFSTLIGGS